MKTSWRFTGFWRIDLPLMDLLLLCLGLAFPSWQDSVTKNWACLQPGFVRSIKTDETKKWFLCDNFFFILRGALETHSGQKPAPNDLSSTTQVEWPGNWPNDFNVFGYKPLGSKNLLLWPLKKESTQLFEAIRALSPSTTRKKVHKKKFARLNLNDDLNALLLSGNSFESDLLTLHQVFYLASESLCGAVFHTSWPFQRFPQFLLVIVTS